jgi:hypothetical protein
MKYRHNFSDDRSKKVKKKMLRGLEPHEHLIKNNLSISAIDG